MSVPLVCNIGIARAPVAASARAMQMPRMIGLLTI
jgi:hypothetical protein